MSIYNEPIEWIDLSIKSILKQSYKYFEFIIINDNPAREENKNLLIRYSLSDSRIKIIKNESNIGLTKSLNKGIEIAKGDYIARMDADDVAEKDRLLTQLNFMERNPDVIVCGSYIRFLGVKNKINKDYRITTEETKDYLIIGSPMAHPSVMMRMESIKEHNLRYDESITSSQDYYFWYTLCKYGKITNIPKVLLNYRLSEKQISVKDNNTQKVNAINLRKRIIHDYFNNKELDNFVNDFCLNREFSFTKFRLISRQIVDNNNDSRVKQQIKLLLFTFLISQPINLKNNYGLIFNRNVWNVGFGYKYTLRVFFNNLIKPRYPQLL